MGPHILFSNLHAVHFEVSALLIYVQYFLFIRPYFPAVIKKYFLSLCRYKGEQTIEVAIDLERLKAVEVVQNWFIKVFLIITLTFFLVKWQGRESGNSYKYFLNFVSMDLHNSVNKIKLQYIFGHFITLWRSLQFQFTIKIHGFSF